MEGNFSCMWGFHRIESVLESKMQLTHIHMPERLKCISQEFCLPVALNPAKGTYFMDCW